MFWKNKGLGERELEQTEGSTWWRIAEMRLETALGGGGVARP